MKRIDGIYQKISLWDQFVDDCAGEGFLGKEEFLTWLERNGLIDETTL